MKKNININVIVTAFFIGVFVLLGSISYKYVSAQFFDREENEDKINIIFEEENDNQQEQESEQEPEPEQDDSKNKPNFVEKKDELDKKQEKISEKKESKNNLESPKKNDNSFEEDKHSVSEQKKDEKTARQTKINVTPKITIKTPQEGQEIKTKNFDFELNVADAIKVEGYIKNEAGGKKMYLGRFVKKAGDIWILNIDTSKKIPNGKYKINAKVMNEYGEYDSETKNIFVNVFIEHKEEEGKQQIEIQHKIQKNGERQENFVKKEGPIDSDGDGLTDENERRLGTDPNLADSDGDGYIDGDEIQNGYNPLKYSPGDKSDQIIFQNPKQLGEVNEEFKVENVKMEKEQIQNIKEERIILSGRALPNTFVNVYIYSDEPIIVTVKTDEFGRWEYKLDKDLSDGNHEAFVVLTDNTGKITSKSNSFEFIKSAHAITTVEAKDLEKHEEVVSPIEQNKKISWIYYFGIILTFIGLTAVIINFVNKKLYQSNE
jgi:hypothetical protein